MTGILLDENLPRSLSLPTSFPIEHVEILGESPTDSDIWVHAEENDLVIITKDADFSLLSVSSEPTQSCPFASRQYASARPEGNNGKFLASG